MGWSRSSFSAKFGAYVGKGPIQFVTHTRLAEAISLLRSNPDLPMWELARRVGYEAQSSFTRTFKSYFGMTPREYVAEFGDVAGPNLDVQKVFVESAAKNTRVPPNSSPRTRHVVDRR
jgi:AraC-like DNA-binding protein